MVRGLAQLAMQNDPEQVRRAAAEARPPNSALKVRAPCRRRVRRPYRTDVQAACQASCSGADRCHVDDAEGLIMAGTVDVYNRSSWQALLMSTTGQLRSVQIQDAKQDRVHAHTGNSHIPGANAIELARQVVSVHSSTEGSIVRLTSDGQTETQYTDAERKLPATAALPLDA